MNIQSKRIKLGQKTQILNIISLKQLQISKDYQCTQNKNKVQKNNLENVTCKKQNQKLQLKIVKSINKYSSRPSTINSSHKTKTQQNHQTQFSNDNYCLSKYLNKLSKSLIYNKIVNNQQYLSFELKDLLNIQLNYSDIFVILEDFHMIKHKSQKSYKINESESQKQQLQKVYFFWKILTTHSKKLINMVSALAQILNIKICTIQNAIIYLIAKINQIINSENINTSVLTYKPIQQPQHIFMLRNKHILSLFGSKKIIFFQQEINVEILDFSNEIVNKTIFTQFQIFRTNRLNYKQNHKKQNSLNEINLNNQLNKLISPRSNRLALSKRLKIIAQLKSNDENIDKDIKNIFLTFKQTKSKCKQNLNLSKQIVKSIKPKTSTKILNENITSIDYCQMKCVKQMKKARKIKQQTRLLEEKGWTNSTPFSSRSSYIKPTLIQPWQSKEISSKVARSIQLKTQASCQFKVQQSVKDKSHKYKNTKIQLCGRKRSFDFQSSDQQNFNVQIDHHQYESKDSNSLDLDKDPHINGDQLIKDQQRRHNTFKTEQTQMNEEQLDLILQNDKQKHSIPQNDKQKLQVKLALQEFPLIASQQLQPQILQNLYAPKSYIRIPILYVDVNMDQNKKQRIIIYQSDNAKSLAQQFGYKHNLDIDMIQKLTLMLAEQISGILERIDEEEDESQQD